MNEGLIKDLDEARTKCPKCNNDGYDFLGGHSAHPGNRVACDCIAGKKFANSGEQQFRLSPEQKKEFVQVPRTELEKLEQARLALYEYLSTHLSEEGLLGLVNITGQIWRVANTKNWSNRHERS